MDSISLVVEIGTDLHAARIVDYMMGNISSAVDKDIRPVRVVVWPVVRRRMRILSM